MVLNVSEGTRARMQVCVLSLPGRVKTVVWVFKVTAGNRNL